MGHSQPRGTETAANFVVQITVIDLLTVWCLRYGQAVHSSRFCPGSFRCLWSTGAGWGWWLNSYIWWHMLAVTWASRSTCLSPSRSLPRASLSEDKVAKRARPSLRGHHIPPVGLCWARSSHKASSDSKKNRNAKLLRRVAPLAEVPEGTWILPATLERKEISLDHACIPSLWAP